MNAIQFLGALELGLVYALVAIGVYLTFRVIDFPDLTVDGSFPLGAAVSASMLVGGAHPLLATVCAFIAGAMSGLVTGYLNIKFKIIGLLAGILTMTGLYSVNLRIMGSPNIALLMEPTLFGQSDVNFVMSLIVLVVCIGLIYFLNTHFGLGLRASGVNARVSQAYGIRVGWMVLVMLALSNGLVAFAGALFAQSQGFADISMGTGTIIIGLASVIIGETLIHTRRISLAIISCVVGAIAYRLAIAFALNTTDIGLKASDLNLITAVLVAVTMILPKIKQSIKQKLCVAKKTA